MRMSPYTAAMTLAGAIVLVVLMAAAAVVMAVKANDDHINYMMKQCMADGRAYYDCYVLIVRGRR